MTQRTATTQRLLNEQPGQGWARIHAPRYVAVEVAGEPGVFSCKVRGPGTWSAAQLEIWAISVAAEVLLIEWSRPATDHVHGHAAGEAGR